MDRGQKETEKILSKVEKRINEEYKQATEEIEEKLNDYLRRFELKDKRWQEWVEEGTKTKDEYKEWRLGQMAVGKRWSDLKEELAHDLVEVNNSAKEKIKSICPEVYAENFNYSTYDIEKQAKINTSFTLYSKESVERLAEEDTNVLPEPGKKVKKDIAEGKAVRWNKQQLQSVMMQGILQGESIPNLATRLANKVGDSNRKAAIRNARTMATGAQNAGRVNAYKRAEGKGVEMEQMWLATHDNRTRHSHRWMDGERRPVGEEFSNKCMFPGDPNGPAAEIYNCRCTLRGVVKGLERRAYKYMDPSGMDGMSYDEWRDAKPVSRDILYQDKVGEAMRRKEAGKYRVKNGIINPKSSGAISGALNPYSEEAQAHADMYYESVRHMKTDYKRIAANTGFSESDVKNVKNYIFMEKHDLGGDEKEYLYPNYDMAESWQRLIDGRNIQPHDITLLNHEIMERKLVEEGYSQMEAHRITEKTYNYAIEADEYNDRVKRNQKGK